MIGPRMDQDLILLSRISPELGKNIELTLGSITPLGFHEFVWSHSATADWPIVYIFATNYQIWPDKLDG